MSTYIRQATYQDIALALEGVARRRAHSQASPPLGVSLQRIRARRGLCPLDGRPCGMWGADDVDQMAEQPAACLAANYPLCK